MASTDQPSTPPQQPSSAEPAAQATGSTALDADPAPSEPTGDQPPAEEPVQRRSTDSPSAAPETTLTEAETSTQPPAGAQTSEVGRGEPQDAASEPADAESSQAALTGHEPDGSEEGVPGMGRLPELVLSDVSTAADGEEQPAPTVRARRRGAARSASVEDSGPAPDEPADATAGQEDGSDAIEFRMPWDPQPPFSTEDPFELAARPAATSLLFQAPEPVVRPPRSQPPPEPSDRVAERGEQPAETFPADSEPTVPSAPDAAEDSGEEERQDSGHRRRRRGGKGRRSKSSSEPTTPPQDDDENAEAAAEQPSPADATEEEAGGAPIRRRTRRRRRSGSAASEDGAPGVVTKVREPRHEGDGVVALRGSTRLEAKKQRRREGREAGRRRTVLTEAEYLARRESVERVMLVRRVGERTQIAVLEDGVLVEHYVSRDTNASLAGNIYVGRVQNVLPSMEAAFVDIGKGRNAVLYAGEVNWDAAGLESGQSKRIENALEPGQSVLVQVTKDPIGHKGARLTSQVSLPGRYLVYVPDSAMTGISRKLPDVERARLKRILRDVVPETAGVIVRTAAEGATEAELRADVERLTATWEQIRDQVETLSRKVKGGAPALLHGEPDLTVRVVRDIFNEDFSSLVVSGEAAWEEVSDYVQTVAPDLGARVSKWTSEEDLFASHRVDEQIAKAMDRKVWLPSGGSLVIDRTEAMTVVDVNTGKFVGSGGNLEETVTRNNIEAAEEIVRQLRLRDIGGIIVIDFIDMVLESNRDLVVRRLLECLGRDRTKHQVAEVTSLGLVQMTRKRVGAGLLEVFSETCEHCHGRGYLVHGEPVDRPGRADLDAEGRAGSPLRAPQPPRGGPTPAQIAAAAHAAAVKKAEETTAPTPSGQPDGEDTLVAEAQESAAPLPSAEPGEPAVGADAAEAGEPSASAPSPEPPPAAEVAGPEEVGEPALPERGASDAGDGSQDAEAREGSASAEDSDGADAGSDLSRASTAFDGASTPSGQEGSPSDGSPSDEESHVSALLGTPATPAVPQEPQPQDLGEADGDEPAAPPRRRRHGRVVAPAGPPRVPQ